MEGRVLAYFTLLNYSNTYLEGGLRKTRGNISQYIRSPDIVGVWNLLNAKE
jgi:hypothetical protein